MRVKIVYNDNEGEGEGEGNEVKIVYINVLMRLVSITPGHVKLD